MMFDTGKKIEKSFNIIVANVVNFRKDFISHKLTFKNIFNSLFFKKHIDKEFAYNNLVMLLA